MPRPYIADAIESVLSQHIPDVEHIIMDGGSTDGTLEILKKYPHLIVVSGPDNGMYDAINKGIGISKGEWIGLLNADDLYPTGKPETGPGSHSAGPPFAGREWWICRF